jgi:HEPN domain-containing protein
MDKVKYWLVIADYDYGTAADLMKSQRWLYVAFMCHQALEKTIKAYYSKQLLDEPPYIHNLTRLAEKSGLYELMNEEQRSFLDAMNPMNIEARYPDYKSRIAASLNEKVCQDIVEQTQQMQSWIKSKL